MNNRGHPSCPERDGESHSPPSTAGRSKPAPKPKTKNKIHPHSAMPRSIHWTARCVSATPELTPSLRFRCSK